MRRAEVVVWGTGEREERRGGRVRERWVLIREGGGGGGGKKGEGGGEVRWAIRSRIYVLGEGKGQFLL